MRCILAELPESLDETYERILRQIPKSNREHAHWLLQCLTVAIRPLHVKELAEVLAIDFSAPGATPILDEKLRWEDKERAVLSACSSLITIVQDKDSRCVQFSHFSVKEFLTSERLATSTVDTLRYHHIHIQSAHTIMTQACLSVLLRLDKSMGGFIIKSYPLARYAGMHFGDHVEFENVLPHVTEGVDNLLDPDKPHFDIWVWLRTDDWNASAWHNSRMDEKDRFQSVRFVRRNRSPTLSKYPPRVSPLYYVAAFGHFSLAHRLISKFPQDLHTMDNKGCTPLHIAVLAGKVEVSQLLIEHSTNLDTPSTEGWTLLHMAAYRGLFEVSRILLERHKAIKPYLNMRNKKGQTALHLASRYHHSSIVALLLKFGADVNARDDYNKTPLHLASLTPCLGTMGLLLKFGADVDSRDDDDMTPLLFALQGLAWSLYEGNIAAAAQLLLELGASVHVQNKRGRMALHMASEFLFPSIMVLLLKFGAEVDAKDNGDMTPLHLALTGLRSHLGDGVRGTTATAVLLVHGASVHMRDKNGRTPLHLASLHQLSRTVALFLKFGAEVDTKDNDDMTPLHLALTRLTGPLHSGVGGTTAAHVLLEHGASIHAKNKNGQIPLHLASLRQVSSMVELLLKLGAETDVRDNDGMTPLLLALRGQRVYSRRVEDFEGSVTARLLMHGVDINVRNKNDQTPLHLASQHHLYDSLALLLSLGADVDAQDEDDMTPLHVAILSSPQPLWPRGRSAYFLDGSRSDEDVKVEVIQLLLKYGANIQVQNNKGDTSLQIAVAIREKKVIRVLSEHVVRMAHTLASERSSASHIANFWT